MQSTSTLFMIRPYQFVSNPETRGSNAFQKPEPNLPEEISRWSLLEFDAMVDILKMEGLEIIVYQDPGEVETPDSIFPNNWISFHHSGVVFLYPMQALNRRKERRWEPIQKLLKKVGFRVNKLIDLSHFELENKFLEGTGSMVLDREAKLAFACISPRTDIEVLQAFCNLANYNPVTFHAFDQGHKAIYHTNVMMCIGKAFVLICLESILDLKEQTKVVQKIMESGKTIIEIGFHQMNHFAGNMLEVESKRGESLIILSVAAYNSLDADQISQLRQFGRLIPIPLPIIEKNGGGSARCMLAEIHLPKT